jgi:DNA-binding MarR family transcriptional regulator
MTSTAGERKPRGDETLSGTGRHLTGEELYTWTRFLDAGRLVEEMLSRHLADEHAMTHLDYEVLVRVDGAGGSMRLSTLAELCVSSKSRLTHAINRLEERGWIERGPVEGDGRGVAAELTAAGRTELAAAAIGHAELIRHHLLGVLNHAEVPVVGGAMDRVSQHLRDRRGPSAQN